ncbi:MAG TPA: hypothetical protein VGU02_03920 [Gaiellaceae bacterium]|nr:hypothetical protein [Gaiellaceae bacterium]
MRRIHPAVSGALAGVVWRAVEPRLQRLFGHPYSDPELATAFVTRGRLQPVLDYAVQATGGATFGVVFTRLGGRTTKQAVLATLGENAALLACSPVIDRIHPDVRDGTWPRLTGNPRAAGVSVSGHLLYAMLFAALLRKRA